jgi:CheY-like chemotaxis protein
VPQTLLLADDSLTIQRVIELTFADEDIDVVAVGDGDQAIARIDSDPPDIVLVDAGMPGRSGYEVAQHIKSAPGLEHIPVLLLTGAFEPVDQQKAADAGCDGILAKPFEPAQVIARVKELLARPSHEARQPPGMAAVEPPHVKPDRTPASEVARLDSYFAQLDAAFATLSEHRPVEITPPAEPPASSLLSIDWFAGASAAPPAPSHREPVPDASASVDYDAARRSALEEPEEPPRVTVPQPPTPASPAEELPQPSLPSLPDAFAAILAAEQREPIPSAPPAWPAQVSAPAIGGLSEEEMEEITRRVVERLSDRVVREMVAELVSGVAERLVREEIERIKASIQ